MPARRWLLFVAFCLISASDWVLPAYLPSTLPQALHAAAAFALAASVLGVAGWALRSRKAAPTWSAGGKIVLYGAGLFVLPSLIASLAGGRVSAGDGVLVFTLVPVAVLLFEAQRAIAFDADGGRLTALLPGALAGAGGAALLLPLSLPTSPVGKLYLAAIAGAGIVAALASVRLPRLIERASNARAAALVCAAGAVANGLVVAGSRTAFRDTAWGAEVGATLAAAALIVAQILLLLSLLRALPATAVSARYLLVPLLALGEGLLLAHAALSATVAVGFALMAGGAAMLLRSARPESDAPDSILL